MDGEHVAFLSQAGLQLPPKSYLLYTLNFSQLQPNGSIVSKYTDPFGLKACAFVTVVDAFGIPGFQNWGGGHSAIEIVYDDGTRKLIELQEYSGGRHNPANRVGEGPLGPSSYLRFAAMLNEYGATDNSVASLLNKLTGKITGDPYNASMSTLESLMVNNLGFGINNYYGLFISPDLPSRGEKHPIALVKGQEKQQLDRMVQEAMEIGRKTYEDAFMEISIPPMSYQGEYGGINFTIDTGNTSSFRLSVGYGYDFITRNSNSFIGTVIRNSNLGLPTNVNRAMGIGNNFTDWTSWDTAIQEMFQEATLNALRDLGAEFK